MGERLTRLHLSYGFTGDLSAFTRPGQLLVLLCTRADDALCRRAEKVCETLLQYMHADPRDTLGQELMGTALGRVVDSSLKDAVVVHKVEMTESRALGQRFNVLTLPQYLMFFDGQLVYQGMLGGQAQRVVSSRRAKAPVVLLAEPTFKQQINTEKLLRKYECKWDLCMSARGALQIKQATPLKRYDLVLLSDQLPIEDVKEIEKSFGASKPSTVLAGMASVSGEYGAERVAACRWTQAVTSDVEQLFDSALFASSVEVGITLPAKSLAIEGIIKHTIAKRGAETWDRDNPEYVGTTTLKLHDQIVEALDAGRRGLFKQQQRAEAGTGLSLSSEDMRVRGVLLKKQNRQVAEGEATPAY